MEAGNSSAAKVLVEVMELGVASLQWSVGTPSVALPKKTEHNNDIISVSVQKDPNKNSENNQGVQTFE